MDLQAENLEEKRAVALKFNVVYRIFSKAIANHL